MGVAEVLVAVLTLLNTVVAGYAAWRIREVKHQVNGMRAQLERAAKAEGVLEGKETEIRRHDDARESLRIEAMRRGRTRLGYVEPPEGE